MQADTRARHEPPAVRRLLEVLAGADYAPDCAEVSAIDLARPAPVGQHSAVIGAVPFSGRIDAASAELRALARTRRADLLAVAWALLALKDGGRFALVVPQSVLEGDTRAHRSLRRRLVEENALQTVIALRAGLFRPRLRAAILVVAKGGASERIGFHQLDAARDIAQLLDRWPVERDAPAAVASFFVRREAIAPPHYALGLERYRAARPIDAPAQPHAILHEVAALEAEILQGIRDLVGMLK